MTKFTHPLDDMLDNALHLAKIMRHGRVMPFHLLTAIVDDQNASNFLAEQGFPINDLHAGVDEIFPRFKRTDIVSDIASSFTKHAGVMSYDALTICVWNEARKMIATPENTSPGYLELLFGLSVAGDQHSKTAICDYAETTPEQIYIMTVQPKNKMDCFPQQASPHTDVKQLPDLSGTQLIDKRRKIIQIAEAMKKNIIGQDAAITTLHEALKRNMAGLKAPNKPLGSFLFPGPTGVGKTEVAKQLAVQLGVELVRLDMSEYMEAHSVSRLISAPPGYKGCDESGIFASTVGKHPDCVLLLDEIEKAHPDIYNILLQVMDNGELTCSNGDKVNFRNTTLIMTSNAGSVTAIKPKKSIGFMPNDDEHDIESKNYKAAVDKLFSPEFRNRLDAVVPFNVLSKPDMVQIAGLMIERLNTLEAAESYDLSFKATQETLQAMVDLGYDPEMGARPIERVINEQIKNVLADYILEDNLSNTEIVIDHDGKGFTFHKNAHTNATPPINDNALESQQHPTNNETAMNEALAP